MTESVSRSLAFPPAPLLAASVLVLASIAIIMTARISDIGTTRNVYSTPAQSRDLRFEDAAGGAITVSDATTAAPIATITPGNDGFVRMVMRVLARQRLSAGIGPAAPFKLTRWDDGRLTITDPTTGHRTDLSGFGASNVHSFAKFLPQESPSP